MTKETEMLEKMLKDKLAAAERASCSKSGHQDVVDFLRINNELDIEQRRDIKRILAIAETNGGMFAGSPWKKHIQWTGLSSIVAGLVYAILKAHGIAP